MSVLVITVDGPSGVGKGTLAMALARRLGWQFLDSGALYRLVALRAIDTQTAFDDVPTLTRLAETLQVRFAPGGDGEVARVFLGADDGSELEVSDRLRLEQTGEAASQVAPHPPVRAALLERQRAFASAPGLVADGRDMGTTVFPSAPLKIYLTASAEERAKRRAKQLKSKGVEASIRDLQREIEARDARDSGRSASPLRPADDACLIDTSTLDANAVLDQVLSHAAERGLLSSAH